MTQTLDQIPANAGPCPRCQAMTKFTAEEAAAMIPNGSTIGFSCFTPAGAAKAVPRALAEKARAMHQKGEDFKVRVLTGASTGSRLDDALAEADAISWRAPYQSSRTLRDKMNREEVDFVDMHLSHVPQTVAFGFFGRINFAVVEAPEVTPDGKISRYFYGIEFFRRA